MKINLSQLRKTIFILVVLTIFHCGKESSEQTDSQAKSNPFGVGPIQSKLDLKEINESLARKGEEIFTSKCTACHKLEERYVGPALKGVTTRRAPEWIMNMVIDPMKMTKEDPTAQELLAEYLTQMTNQNINEEDARALLEYFRKIDSK